MSNFIWGNVQELFWCLLGFGLLWLSETILQNVFHFTTQLDYGYGFAFWIIARVLPKPQESK